MAVLFQLKLDQSIVDCGMSYVLQLDSGRFFLIDGGYFTPGEAERLYRFLCEHAEGKPVIDSWFFSHAHQDHIGVFLDMMETHRDDLVIGRLIYNFQPLPLPETSDGWRQTNNDLATVKRFYEVADRYCAVVPTITPHTGDSWQTDEISFQVLYTHEDLDVQSNFNDHSTVLRAETAGWSLLFLGDLYKEGSRILLNTCPEKLKCDIVQVAHHGFAGATRELYRATEARYALWPSTEENIADNITREANDYLLHHSGVQRHLIGGNGTICLVFPPRNETGDNLEISPVV